MPDDYEVERAREQAARLHDSLRRGGRRFQSFSDWFFQLAGGFVLLVVLAFAGFQFFPITHTLADFLIWLAVPPLATVALALLARSLRRRRHGLRPSSHIQRPSDVSAVVLCGWFGFAAMAAFVADARGGDGLTGLGIGCGVLGACLLVIDAVLVHRYVVRE